METKTLIKTSELNPPLKVTLIRDISQTEGLLDFFSKNKAFGWDIETTTQRDFYWRRCRTIQFGNQTEQYVIDLLRFTDDDPQLLLEAQGKYGANLSMAPKLSELLNILKPVLCSKDFLKVGVNLGFEYMTFYWNFGIRAFNFFDCSVVEKCIYAGYHSLKDYGFFGMEEMMGRYFNVSIDKELQTSFNLSDLLSQEQVEYAALDTRFPMGLRSIQTLILQGQTAAGLKQANNPAWRVMANVDPILTGDNLLEVALIENNAIGAFQDMHIHGERLDVPAWTAHNTTKKEEMRKLISEVLDPIFLPLVGSKYDIITDQEIEEAQLKWKAFNQVSDEEVSLRGQIRVAKKSAPQDVPDLVLGMAAVAQSRLEQKEYWKKVASDLGKKRTKIRKLATQCEGEALINYGSDAQLISVLRGMKGLKNINNLDDQTLEKYEHVSVIAAIRKYHGLAKEIGTYGDAWVTQWVTKPCKDEGWLHPGDGRLHCVFNQYDAETGRSSSERPNGQNLPQDKEIRSCFIADDPNESIRLSNCCDANTKPHTMDGKTLVCCGCHKEIDAKDTHAETYKIVTVDMSGAELRIIAELAHDPIWCTAFKNNEDVHSVCTELIHGDDWKKLTEPGCSYYEPNEDGTPKHLRCKCKGHNVLRNETKAVNFLLAYGGGPNKLAISIGKTRSQAQTIMATHELRFPKIWFYLKQSGLFSKIHKKSFDLYGRRRLFPEPTQERAIQKAKDDLEERLRLTPEESAKNVEAFIASHGVKPSPEEKWELTHRQPSQREISHAMIALASSIERQGKNHAIQGTNATIAKIAMGSGFDSEGVPFLWHLLSAYNAKLIKFVHDELVIQAPTRFAETVAKLVQDTFRRAAAIRMKEVTMESEYGIAEYWKK